jgi:hypothetical protein
MKTQGLYRKYVVPFYAFVFLQFTGVVMADELAYSGWSIGSTHLVGYDYEIVRDDHSTQYSLGLFELAPTAAITWKRFHVRNGSRFYYGAGPWLVMAITPDEGGVLAAARAVTGMEWDLSRNTKWGIELSINLPLYVQSLWGPERTLNQISAFPFPGVFYRKSF